MEDVRILGRGLDHYGYRYAPGLWVLTAYYNPLGYRSRRANYDVFIGLLRASGIRTLTVECAFGDQPFDLPESVDVLRVRCKTLLWQKERLLNLALPWLPASCRYVAWLDCDLVFTNRDWAPQTVRALDRVPLVQVFDACTRLPRAYDRADCAGDRCVSFARVVADTPVALRSGRYDDHGHTGYGWAARREVLDQHGLYAHAVLGSADHYMAHAAVGDLDSGCILRILGRRPEQLRHLRAWSECFHRTVAGGLGVVPGEVLHLWHGDLADRKYYLRHLEFHRFAFDPHTDLVGAPGRPFELRDEVARPELVAWFRSYFEQRHEDGIVASSDPGP